LKILKVPPLAGRLFGDIVVFLCVRLPSKMQQSHPRIHPILPASVQEPNCLIAVEARR
jgi:hypothetical protein